LAALAFAVAAPEWPRFKSKKPLDPPVAVAVAFAIPTLEPLASAVAVALPPKKTPNPPVALAVRL
jgi:hypothetical protein